MYVAAALAILVSPSVESNSAGMTSITFTIRGCDQPRLEIVTNRRTIYSRLQW